MNNKNVNPIVPIKPNSNLKPGTIVLQDRVYYQVKDNNTASVIGVAPTRRRNKVRCSEICMTGYINPSGTSSVPCSPTPQALKQGFVGQSYSNPITAIGGTAPYTYAITSGSLPMNCTIGTIEPTNFLQANSLLSPGIYGFTITITDANGCKGSQNFTIQVNP